MKKPVIISVILSVMLVLAGCGSVTVGDLVSDPDSYVGKKVVVSGKVVAPLKIGSISGFTLKDGKDSILVSSDDVPSADAQVQVKGTFVKGLMMPHYIYADKIIIK